VIHHPHFLPMSCRLLTRVSLSCVLVGMLGQCKKPAPAAAAVTGEVTLATVAGQTITEKDLIKEAEWRRANHQAVPAPEDLLKEMVNRLALVARAKQAGLDSETETKRRIESLLIASLREKELDDKLAKIEVTDDELKAGYEARQEEFTRKGLDRFAILFQAIQPNASPARREEAKQRLNSAIAQAEANPAPGGRGAAAGGFGTVAAEFSEDQISRFKGGDIGWMESGVTQTRLPAAVLDAGRPLATGKHSGIVEAPDGYYVIMKSDARPGGVRPFEEVSDRLLQVMLREKRRQFEERFLEESLAAAKAVTDADAAKKVSLPNMAPALPSPDTPPAFPMGDQPAVSR